MKMQELSDEIKEKLIISKLTIYARLSIIDNKVGLLIIHISLIKYLYRGQ